MKTYRYVAIKEMEIAGSHHLTLPYESKCTNVHGHNWIVKVHVGADKLNDNGMVLDFALIKKNIHNKLDHGNLNEIFDFNPTAENIAEWIAKEINVMATGIHCFKVEIYESKNNLAVFNDVE